MKKRSFLKLLKKKGWLYEYRFYYAAFHAARALLAIKGLDSSKHSAVISLFNREFVKPGLISKESAKTLAMAFAERSEADYDDFKEFDEEETKRIKQDIENFMEEAKKYLSKQ
ncbi:HEPN domain-containing protein [Thermoanaerobacteraceae bacterium SP2]|nr:HEPN domain-containing protein [Thermoanaerobacteraceae bacterium SP2]